MSETQPSGMIEMPPHIRAGIEAGKSRPPEKSGPDYTLGESTYSESDWDGVDVEPEEERTIVAEPKPAAPEQLEQPPKHFQHEASVLIRDGASGDYTPQGLAAKVDGLLGDILGKVDAGQIAGSRGVYSRQMIMTQLKDFVADVNKGKGLDAITAIPNAEGMRRAFAELLQDPTMGAVLVDRVQAMTRSKELAGTLEKRAEALKTEVEARELGDTAFDGNGGPLNPGSDFNSQASRSVRAVVSGKRPPLNPQPIPAPVAPRPTIPNLHEQMSGTPTPQTAGYEHLFADDYQEGSVESAAVRPDEDSEKESAARRAADEKYNRVVQAGGTAEEAQAAADRVWQGLRR